MDYKYTYTAPNGLVINFHSDAFTALADVDGFLLPDFDFIVYKHPDRQTVSRITTDVRKIRMEAIVRGTNQESLQANLALLARAMYPDVDNPGVFRLKKYNGEEFLLYCHYESGMEGQFGPENDGLNWVKVVLRFNAYDPLFYAVEEEEVTAEGLEADPFFPIFPLELTDDVVFSNQEVSNPGSAVAWPIWTFEGPGSNIIITNNTTGKTLTLSTTLISGDVLEIDTRPGYKTIKKNGSSVFSDISASSELWSLAVGVNDVSVSFSNTDSNSTVTLVFTPAYISL